jgi:multiple sugar transport system permease protein
MTHTGLLRDLSKTAIGLIVVGLLLFPLYWMVNASFQPHTALLAATPTWFPNPPIFDGYLDAFRTQGGSILTSCALSGGAALVSLSIAAPCAFALVTFRMRWTTIFIFILLLVQMIPNIVMANSLYTVFARAGWLNTWQALVLADASHSCAFAILLVRAFMVTLPRTLTEAALVDGASYWGAFFRVVLPLSRNGLVTAGLFCFLFAWSDFLYSLTISTKQKIVPVTLSLYQFIGNHGTNWTDVMATAVLASIPPIVLLLLGQRQIAAGLMGGAVKE